MGGGDAYYGFRVHSILNDGEHPVHVGVDESFPSAVATGISLTRDYGCVPYSNNTGRLYDVSMPGDDYLFRTDSLVGAHCIRSTWPHLYTLAGAIGAATFSVSRLQPSERVGAVIGYASSHPQDTATFVDAIYDVQYCYTANHDGGVIVYDVSDPWNPEQVGGVTTPSAETLWIRSDTLFVACGSSGLRAFDIGDDPAEPANITPGSMTSHAAYDIVVYEEKAYIAAGTEGVLVRDLNDTEWDVIGTYNTLGDARGIALRMDASSRTVAYVADGQDGLVLVNAGTPSSMSVLGSFDTGMAKRVVIRDGAAYVADADSGLVIVSVANSTSLSRLSRVAMKNARDVALCGDLAYVADDAFVRVVNCSDTASPARTGVLDCYGPVIGVGGGNYIWAATEDSLMVGLLQAISAPKIITGTCHFHYTIGVDLLADWEFSWRTEEWTDPRLVAVEIIEEGVGSYWLTRDGGAETSVIPVRSGGYLNRLVMRDQVCNGGWEADYVGRSSFQDVDGMRSVTSQSHLKVKLCIAW